MPFGPTSQTEKKDPLDASQSTKTISFLTATLDRFHDAPIPARLLVYVGASITILTLIIPPLLVTADAKKWAAICFLASLTALLLVALASLIFFRHWTSNVVHLDDIRCEWRVPRLPLEDNALGELSQCLEHARNAALSSLANITLDNNQVRANIFLPDYRAANQGVACELSMPRQLRHMMKDETELGLALLPGEGATGQVFLSGTSVVTTDRYYGIHNAKKRKLISDKLQALVSLPLKYNNHVLGVMNIDFVLRGDNDPPLTISYEELDNLRHDLQAHYVSIAEKILSTCPHGYLAICLRKA